MKNIMIITTILLTTLLFVGCSKSIESSANNIAIEINLSTPPPGSNATQEKWDTFDDVKRQESWDKYITDSAAESSTEEVVSTPGSGGGGSSSVAVVVGELTKAPINIYYYGLGELKAGDEIKVNSASNGAVKALYVSEGDFVEPGDLLFSLDSGDFVKNIERASDKWDKDLELSRIKLSEISELYETSNSLYNKELISKSEYDKAKQSLKEAELNYEKIQLSKTTEIENLQENLRDTLAISPSRGYVSDISFNNNEIINTADFVEIINIDKIEVLIQVPEDVITKVKLGLKVVAKKASSPDYVLSGTITSIGLKSNSNRTFDITAEFDNPNQKLLPGMLMETQIEMIQLTTNFIVPKTAIITEGINHFIFLVSENIAKKVPVELGKSKDSYIQINGSIKEGDLLVLVGQTYLQKGSAVKIIETKEYLPEKAAF